MTEEKSTTRALRDEFSPDRVESKLQEIVEERPKAKYLLDFTIVGKALIAAVVIAAVLWLIFSPQLAGIALVLVFLGAWLGLAQLSYDKRRQTRDADPNASGYEGDRGEVEAEREQEDEDDDGKPSSRNGSAPERETAGSNG